ncbi:nucleoside phosphorylase domain-containing protein [Ilyonectria sp. MPI-CAGE-AT-0026]|nr:nucleoside phosphorylase domain-containing protein [Ilyonectria sp. MPI-CAGE-AT-0026]
MSRLREIQPEEVTVAIFCALTDESVAVRLTLEEELKCPTPGRKYLYNFGRIGEHKIVIAQPIEVGTVDTSNLAAYVSNAFKNVRFALMVGIGGGIPSEKNDIRLGDIAVSKAGSGHPGVIQYDFVKYGADSVVERKGTLNKTHPVLQSADIMVEQDEMMGRSELYLNLSSISRTDPKWRRPMAPDILYAPSFHHVDKGKDCTACEQSSCREVVMRDGGRDAPKVHRGLILSGSGDVKDPEARQRLSRGLDGALCFEMGAAGIMDEIPCLVIRGICDYCDTHKQDDWHYYAAAVAAAYAHTILLKIPGQEVHSMEPMARTMLPMLHSINQSFDLLGKRAADAAEGAQLSLGESDQRMTYGG